MPISSKKKNQEEAFKSATQLTEELDKIEKLKQINWRLEQAPEALTISISVEREASASAINSIEKRIEQRNETETSNKKLILNQAHYIYNDIANIDNTVRPDTSEISITSNNEKDIEITETFFVNLKMNKMTTLDQQNYLSNPKILKKDKQEGKMVGVGLGGAVIVTTIVAAVITTSFVGAAAVFVIGLILAGMYARKLGQRKGAKEVASYKENNQSTMFVGKNQDNKQPSLALSSSQPKPNSSSCSNP
ncbi:MAG: hypothetical protein HKM04_01640 [Legionellales bacterium]|nr:hypothetical protein [Legionellales bacterium]